MTSLRERLERKIESDSIRYRNHRGYGNELNLAFKAGANSLLPLLCELAEALGKAKGALGYAYEDHSDQYYLNVKQDLEEALQAIEKFVEGEK